MICGPGPLLFIIATGEHLEVILEVWTNKGGVTPPPLGPRPPLLPSSPPSWSPSSFSPSPSSPQNRPSARGRIRRTRGTFGAGRGTGRTRVRFCLSRTTPIVRLSASLQTSADLRGWRSRNIGTPERRQSQWEGPKFCGTQAEEPRVPGAEFRPEPARDATDQTPDREGGLLNPERRRHRGNDNGVARTGRGESTFLGTVMVMDEDASKVRNRK